MKVMYLDESGDHNLHKINPVYPVFVLGGVIVDRAYARTVIAPALDHFKVKHFGRTDVILHTVDMGKGRGDYGFLANSTKRTAFFADLNAMLTDLDYMVVACVIDKAAHARLYGERATDPYHHSLEILVEQFCGELGEEVDSGLICAEKRNPGHDRDLMAAWDNLLANGLGAGQVHSTTINERVVALDLKDKKPNIAGLQLADLVITPIGRRISGMPPKPDKNEVLWTVVEQKLRRFGGTYEGKGLILRL